MAKRTGAHEKNESTDGDGVIDKEAAMRRSKTAIQQPDAHVCSMLCTCAACGGPTWYYFGKHVCRRAACGASR